MASPLRDAIDKLYHDHGPALLTYATTIVGSRAAAQDVLHQVFLKLLSGKVQMPDDPKPYLFRAVRNAALNHRRGTIREVEYDDTQVRFIGPFEQAGSAADLGRALADLPSEQRQIVILKVWGQLTLQEAADLLEIPLNTAASRYRYALEKLRERMGVPGKAS